MADEPISALTLFGSYSTADCVEILDGETVSPVWPKTAYTWTDRLAITKPDYTTTLELALLAPVPCAGAGSLIVTADGNQPGGAIVVDLVLWDERGKVMAVKSATITLSDFAVLPSGNYAGTSAVLQGIGSVAGYSVVVQSICGTNPIVNLHFKLV